MSIDPFHDLLLENERVLWTGRPKPKLWVSPTRIAFMIVGLGLFVFSLFGLTSMVANILSYDGPLQWYETCMTGSNIRDLIILLISSTTILGLIGRFRQVASTHFALSEKRAFIAIVDARKGYALASSIAPAGSFLVKKSGRGHQINFSVNADYDDMQMFEFEFLSLADYTKALEIVKAIIGTDEQ